MADSRYIFFLGKGTRKHLDVEAKSKAKETKRKRKYRERVRTNEADINSQCVAPLNVDPTLVRSASH